MRSLMPSPESSMAAMTAGVEIAAGALAGEPNSRTSSTPPAKAVPIAVVVIMNRWTVA